jgi:hypothetical protein
LIPLLCCGYIASSSFLENCFCYVDTDQGANDAANGSANPEARERCHDWPCGDKRTDAWNSKSSDPREEPQSSSNYSAGRNASGSAFRCFSVFLMSEGAGALIVGKKN